MTLDLSLPDIDGVEVCRQIRVISDCYVIVISARTSEVDRLVGLEVGRRRLPRQAVLHARAAGPRGRALPPPAHLRPRLAGHQRGEPPRTPRSRCRWPAGPPINPATGAAYSPAHPLGCDDLSLNTGSREVTVSGEEVDLTRTEFDLLAHLVRNPGVVVAREELMRAVWSTEFVPDSTHVVDVHLANLRRKLRRAAADNQWIRTIRGVGFRYDPCCP